MEDGFSQDQKRLMHSQHRIEMFYEKYVDIGYGNTEEDGHLKQTVGRVY